MTRPRKPDVLRHFKLQRYPFGPVAGDAEFWRSPEFAAALDMISYAVDHDDAVAIVGDIGAGKSGALTWVRRCFEATDGREVLFVTLHQYDKKRLTIGHVLEAFLREFTGEQPPPQSAQKRGLLVRRNLAQCHKEGRRRICLLVDEAHRVSGAFLKSLKEFHEATRYATRSALFAICYVGHPELVSNFQRVAPDVWARLDVGNVLEFGAMSPQEVSAYIAHRTTAVGAQDLFDEPARLAIGRIAHTPLDINRACAQLMDAAFLGNQRTVGLADVYRVYNRLDLARMLGYSSERLGQLAGLGSTTVNDILNNKGRYSEAAATKLDNALTSILAGTA